MIPKIVIDICVALRQQGLKWPEVADKIAQLGHRSPTGQQWHNAALASATVAMYPEMRLRTPLTRKAKNKMKKKRAYSRRSVGSGSNLSRHIQAMEKAGVSPDMIVRVLKKY